MDDSTRSSDTQSVSSRRRWPHSTLQASFEEFRRKNFRIRRTSAREAQKTEQNQEAQNLGCKIQRGNMGGLQRKISAIKVSTAKSRPPSERWTGKAIRSVIATPDTPNPKDPSQLDPRSERETSGLDFGVTGGQDLPKQRVQIEEDTKRDFRITERLLSEYGFTVGCKGREAKLTGNGVKPHSHEFRARLEEVMRTAVLHRRDARMRQSAHERQHTRREDHMLAKTKPIKRQHHRHRTQKTFSMRLWSSMQKGRQTRILLQMIEIQLSNRTRSRVLL